MRCRIQRRLLFVSFSFPSYLTNFFHFYSNCRSSNPFRHCLAHLQHPTWPVPPTGSPWTWETHRICLSKHISLGSCRKVTNQVSHSLCVKHALITIFQVHDVIPPSQHSLIFISPSSPCMNELALRPFLWCLYAQYPNSVCGFYSRMRVLRHDLSLIIILTARLTGTIEHPFPTQVYRSETSQAWYRILEQSTACL